MIKFFLNFFSVSGAIDWERDLSRHRHHTTRYEDLCQ